MRVVIQRVKEASVRVNNDLIGKIDTGLLVFVGIETADSEEDIQWLSHKIINLRIFNDDDGVMNKSVLDIGGSILLISQFTLHAATQKGNRPSYSKAARPEIAIPVYEKMITVLNSLLPKPIATGSFGADMQVSLVNDGPVTIMIDSRNRE
ncbi:MAG: D-tyrosyl-tRNA(Tyr) deacylase [Sediminibacterium sp.]|jgi:D-tyrosyl-tRNA(Tyr) deacylase|nr:D-tyrosyl-tRNA(Tyr) deacylase [Sediminibacterium sp.]MBX9779361.1 D-tyrosyl-tRNA(Tyr) deacylase [Chitinophagaceae bacterium]